MAELGFWETLIIVISPIIIGAISTHFLTRSWQKYQHKISLKQELIDLYNESIFSLRTRQMMLINEIGDSLSDVLETNDELIEKSSVRSKIHFPQNPKEDLENRFNSKYVQLTQIAAESSNKRSLFRTRLQLYSDDESLQDEITSLAKNNFKHRMFIHNLLKSKNVNELKANMEELNKLGEEFSSNSKKFIKKIIQLKIKDIPV